MCLLCQWGGCHGCADKNAPPRRPCYCQQRSLWGSYRLFTQVFQPYGIDFSFVDMTDLSLVNQALRPSTKMIWIETPTNPLLRIVDIRALSTLARDHGAVSVVDNTFASPYLQRPLEHGADAVMHSATKYLAGHSRRNSWRGCQLQHDHYGATPFSGQIHRCRPRPYGLLPNP